MAHSRLYFDHSTAAPPSPVALSKTISSFKEMWGTPTSPHQSAQKLYPHIQEALRSLYSLVGANEEDDIIITSSSAEAINHIISSVYYDVTRLTGKNHFVVGATDEASSIMATAKLEPLGCVSRMAVVNKQGVITAESVGEAISPRTALVSLCWANGMTGAIHQIAEIALLCKQRGILLHLDATHILGKLFFDLKEIAPDFITFNGSQLHAPDGIGAVYVRKGIKLSSLIAGGNEQGGLRAGNYSVPLLLGFGAAAQEAQDSLDFLCTETARLRDLLESEIIEGYPEASVVFKETQRLPHCTTLLFPGIATESLMYAVDYRGVSACMGGGQFQQLGMNLAASGIDELLSHSALSFSLGRYTTEDDVLKCAAIVTSEAKRLRAISGSLINEVER